jgi:hypothetical protein
LFLTSVGYRTVAINSIFNGSAFDSRKKNKKGEVQEKGDMIPPPANQDIIRVSICSVIQYYEDQNNMFAFIL